LPKLLRWIGYAGALGLLGVYVFLAVAGPSPVTTIPGTQQKLEQLRETNRKLRDEIKARQDYLDEVEKNPELRTREYRKRFNKQKPGETTIFLPE
jgi:hypothetical protein